jgi:hypothetical protein
MGSGRSLYEALAGLGTEYFLIAPDRYQGPLPDDEFFRDHFKLVYTNANAMLFQLISTSTEKRDVEVIR